MRPQALIVINITKLSNVKVFRFLFGWSNFDCDRSTLILSGHYDRILQNTYNTCTERECARSSYTHTSSPPQGKCSDNSKVYHTHSHKYAVYQVEHTIKVSTALKGIRELIHEVRATPRINANV